MSENEEFWEELTTREDQIRVYTEPVFFMLLSLMLITLSTLVTLAMIWLIVQIIQSIF